MLIGKLHDDDNSTEKGSACVCEQISNPLPIRVVIIEKKTRLYILNKGHQSILRQDI